jgi:hypothetical protein
MPKNFIPTLILTIWGAAIVLYGLSHGVRGGGYGAGQLMALVFGAVLCFAGGRQLVRMFRPTDG